MQLIAFRIKCFRSIVDTGWIRFSPDNITALVGQNESGKTAILEALAATFSSTEVVADDFRHDDGSPEVWVKTSHSPAEVEQAVAQLKDQSIISLIMKEIGKGPLLALWQFPSSLDDDGTVGTTYNLVEPALVGLKNSLIKQFEVEIPVVPSSDAPDVARSAVSAPEAPATVPSSVTPPAPIAATTPPATPMPPVHSTPLENAAAVFKATFSDFERHLYDTTSTIVLFQEDSGLLPDRIDVVDFKLEGSGITAAQNFLAVADLNLKALVNSDTRSRAALLRRANQKVTNEFLAFWTQTIGKKTSLELECSIHHYPADHEKLGKTYLEFLISDGATPLYPKQRSRGTRWFISFFLQLQASALKGRKRIFLLDEPGANLHEKAQSDVLALLEKIKAAIPVIYSTHSPHLISYDSIHRILAVERDPDAPGHPTRVIDSHSLGAASIDTLSPILTTMGVALSRQTAIQQHDNVLLEELSGYYYLKAFWRLTQCEQAVHFLAATGASNLPQLANLFLGWGLDFIVVVDDEPSGRSVYKSMKRDLFLDREEWAKARMLRIPNCEGIEDIFEPTDFKVHVLRKPEVQISAANSKWAKTNGAAKAIYALGFLRGVEAGNTTLSDLHSLTVARIQGLVVAVTERLASYARNPPV
jgi:predicted ATP-binding protein involved in virulence